jgi:eukaryotic-like serine/threonine-protein kinase
MTRMTSDRTITPTLPETPEDADPDLPARGMSVGRFILLGSLGTGGAATVLSAYDPQLDRKVALKLLRSDAQGGPLSDTARARLVREAQAMARLSHPNVVAVHEVVFGEKSTFLVMEQVAGNSLRHWLAKQARRHPEILDVLLAAGAGLAAAHRAGLVHHDIKPDNILVGDDGRARVSDFGLAGEGTPGSGTRAYMAPEQLGDGTVDARADQYAFCVTLWEALHGARPPAAPVPPRARKAPRRVYRALLRGLAPDPDSRFPSMDALLASLRRPRRLVPWVAAGAAALALVGILAFVAGRGAVAPSCGGAAARLAGVWDNGRRAAAHAAFQATGLAFADDEWRAASDRLDAYARGWIAMHTDACRATHVEGRQSAALLDLRMDCLERRRARVGSLVELWSRGMDAKTVAAAVDAVENLPPLAECADARALTQARPVPAEPGLAARIAAARRSVDAAETMFSAGRVAESRAAAAAARVEAEATGWPQARAEATFLEGVTLLNLGDPRAEPVLVAAARLAWEASDDRLAALALARLADHQTSDRRRAATALLVTDIAEGAQARAGRDAAMRIDLLRIRGAAHYMAGELPAARRDLDEARAVAAATPAVTRRAIERIDSLLVLVMEAQGEYAGARAVAEENLRATIAVHGEEHPLVAVELNNLALVLYRLSDREGSARAFRRSLEIKEKLEGLETASAATTMGNLGGVEVELGHLEEAEALQQRALAIGEKLLGPEHPTVAVSLTNLALLRREQGRIDEALALDARALAIKEKAFGGAAHAEVAVTIDAMGWLHDDAGRPAAALERFRQGLAIREKALGADHPTTQWSRASVAWALAELGHCDEATALAAKAVAVLAKVDPGDPEQFNALVAQGRCELRAGQAPQAAVTLQRAVALAEKNFQPVQRGLARASLARALWDSGRRGEAVAAARQAEPELATRPMGERERAALRAWLAQHGG